MTNDELRSLLEEALQVLERYMFDGEHCRDDIAEICIKIDDLTSAERLETSAFPIEADKAA
jgi:hypothetical protein